MDEDHPYEGPPPDVYGRVTNPEWYIVTHTQQSPWWTDYSGPTGCLAVSPPQSLSWSIVCEPRGPFASIPTTARPDPWFAPLPSSRV